MWYDHWGYGPMGWGMGLGMLLFWGVVIAALVIVVRGLGSGREGGPDVRSSSPNAREILDQRYARGEINREEYEQKRKDLERV